MGQVKIGVTAATGQLGRKIIALLKQVVPAEQIVALVRNPEKAADLGVEVRPFDYNDTAGIANGLQGISKLLLISSSEVGKRFAQHKNVIDEAQKAGLPFIAYTSLLRADVSPIGLAPEHKATEEHLKVSGLNYTILRNGWYTENYTASIGSVLEQGAVYGSAGEGKISAATREDYAEAAVAVLTTDGHYGKVYELGGPAFTLSEYAATISALSDRAIRYVNLPLDEFAGALEQAGLPKPMAELFSAVDAAIEKGALETESQDLSNLIGRAPTPLEDVVGEALKGLERAAQ